VPLSWQYKFLLLIRIRLTQPCMGPQHHSAQYALFPGLNASPT
jgi:hypothetical protein